jgi:tRNA (guanine-N7-)-methyltransferase
MEASDAATSSEPLRTAPAKTKGKRPRDDEEDGPREEKIEKPKKADFRQRAHCNPLSDFVDKYPISPDHVDWSVHYPEFFARENGGAVASEAATAELRLNTVECPIEYAEQAIAPQLNGRAGPAVRFLDVGCGFGGLLVALGPQFPDKLVLGMEIREQVTNYVGQRIRALRRGVEGESSHFNCSVIRTNAMKFLPNYFRKGQLEKMFFCFPDPHFKRKNFRRRIISQGLLSIYAYVMAPGALLYHATDVVELHEWMDRCCKEHPLFEAVSREEQASDPCVGAVSETEEAKRVHKLGRFGHDVHLCVYRRVPIAPTPASTAAMSAPSV